MLAVPHPIDEDDVLRRIPIVAVVRCELEMPLPLAGIGVQRDHGVREEIVAGSADGAVDLRSWISDRPIQSVKAGIIRSGQPHRTGAGFPTVPCPGVVAEFTRSGNRVPAPDALTARRIVRVHKTTRAALASAYAGNDFIFHH